MKKLGPWIIEHLHNHNYPSGEEWDNEVHLLCENPKDISTQAAWYGFYKPSNQWKCFIIYSGISFPAQRPSGFSDESSVRRFIELLFFQNNFSIVDSKFSVLI